MPTIGMVRCTVALVALATLLAACGGGGNGGGGVVQTTLPNPTAAPVPAAVVTEQRFVRIGPCYFCSPNALAAARVTIDGESATNFDVGTDSTVLATGVQTVTSRGSISTSTTRFESVQVSSAIVGRIEALDLARGSLRILGQDVRGVGSWISAAAWPNSADASPPSLRLARLTVGDRVRVSGDVSDDGIILATEVHPPSASAPDRVRGTIRRIDLATRTLTIGALSVDYSLANLEGFPDGALAAGDRVEVIGTATAAPSGLRATSIAYRDAPLAIATGVRLEANGLVERLASTRLSPGAETGTARFGGHVLRLASVCGVAAVSGLPSTAYARALVDGAGLLQPLPGDSRSCQLAPVGFPFEALVTGAVTPLDAARSRFALAGLVVDLPPGIAWVDSAGRLADRSSARDGDVMRLGLVSTAVPGSMVASTVDRTDIAVIPPAGARIEGWMTGSPQRSVVTVLGRTIQMDAETRAGLRGCDSATGTLTDVSPDSFPGRTFAGTQIRWIVATIMPLADASWRAVSIEAYQDAFCD